MNELQIFENPMFGTIRTLEENGKVLFCAKDVAMALGYKNTTEAIGRHCRGVVKRNLTDSLGRDQETNFISEGDIYRLAAKSELPGADDFEKWIFDEVLPSIRKHGAYMTPETLEKVLCSPDTIIQIATALKQEQEKSKALEAVNSQLAVQNQIMAPKAEYFDELVDRNLLTGIRETAKELGYRQKDFVQLLIKRKYVYRDQKGKLMPYAQHIENGLFELKESTNQKTDWSGTQTMITPKGRETFRLLYPAMK